MPLVWCWHLKSNLDHTRCLAPSMGLDVWPFLPPQPKPGPYFTARYTGAMGIKCLAQGHNRKIPRSRGGLELTTLKLLPQGIHTYKHTENSIITSIYLMQFLLSKRTWAFNHTLLYLPRWVLNRRKIACIY